MSNKQFHPFQNYILIDKIDEDIVSSSGLSLTSNDTTKMITSKGIVIGTGNTCIDGISEGDIVHYMKGRSFKIMVGELQKTMIRDGDVVAIEVTDLP